MNSSQVSIYVSLIASLCIATMAGKYRKIGFWWSLFISVFAFPVIGALITFLSTKKDAPYRDRNTFQIIVTKLLAVFVAIIGVNFVYTMLSRHSFALVVIDFFMFGIGLIGVGVYSFVLDEYEKQTFIVLYYKIRYGINPKEKQEIEEVD